jgi:hypothetical protein
MFETAPFLCIYGIRENRASSTEWEKDAQKILAVKPERRK